MSYTDELLTYLINWLPTLLILAIMLFLIKRLNGGTAIQKSHMELARRQADSLERIAAALEKRS